MDLYWKFSLLIVTIIAASPKPAFTVSDYYFITHTFSNLSCDPYTNKHSSSLALECSVQGPKTTNTSFIKIVWYRTLENTSTIQNLNNLFTNQSEQVEIEEQMIAVSTSEIVIVRSVLRVANLNSNNVSGEYRCTLEDQMKPLLSENVLVQPLTLHPSNVYQGLKACHEGAIHTAVANNRTSPSTSSSSSSTISTPLATTSSLSASTSTIENSWTTGGIPITSSSISLDTSNALSFLEMTWNIVFTATIGVLFFVVHVLLVILGCICCRRKQKGSKKEKESLPQHHSATSLTSCSTIPEVHHISPTTSPLVPPTILRTPFPPPLCSPPDLDPLSKSQNCSPPKMKKLPQLPAHFTLPSHFMNEILVPTPEINVAQWQEETEVTNIQNGRGRQKERAESEVLHSFNTQAKKPRQKKISLGERMGGKVTDTKQSQCLVFPKNGNNPAIIINNRAANRLPEASFASLQFEDNITNKYKSLNKDMMEAYPVYDNPHCIRSNDGNQLVKLAVEHAQPQLPSGRMNIGNTARESMDGEYVLPNEVVWAASTSLSKELAAREQPDYVTIS